MGLRVYANGRSFTIFSVLSIGNRDKIRRAHNVQSRVKISVLDQVPSPNNWGKQKNHIQDNGTYDC
jgi:hypothetical protein